MLAAAGVLALIAVAARRAPRIVRTAGGWAFVRTLRDPEGVRVRVLSQGGVYQSASYVGARRSEPVFAYIKAFDAVFAAEGALRAATGHGVERVLALGGGGFSWPKHALTSHVGLSMDVVEIDPAVVAAARRWFFLDELERCVGGRLHVIEADGRAFLEERATRIADLEADMISTVGAKPDALRYDAIVNDTFIGDEPVRALATVEAVQAAHTCLTPDGVYATNVVARDGDATALRDIAATLTQVFEHVHVIPVEEDAWASDENYIVVATDADVQFTGAIPFDEEFLGRALRDATLMAGG